MARSKKEETAPEENPEAANEEADTSALEEIQERKDDTGTPEVGEDETTNEGHPVDEAWSEDPNLKPTELYTESLDKGYIGEQVKETDNG